MRLPGMLWLPLCVVSAVGALTAVTPAARAATTTIEVSLTDATAMPPHDGMGLMAMPDTVKAGRITFHAVNQSKTLVHEMILVQPPANGAALPYVEKTGLVNEDRIKSLGEVSELEPGKSGNLTVTLKPGRYLLICNQANHYKGGMQQVLTVTP